MFSTNYQRYIRPIGAFLACLLAANTGMGAQRVVVLANGNVVQGEVRQTASQVIVATQAGEIRLATADVEFVAATIEEAYRKKARALRKYPSSDGRASLVRWCLQNGLKVDGLRELAELQQVDPSSNALPYLQQLAVNAGKTDEVKTPLATTLPTRHREHADVVVARQHLDRLSRKTIADYVRGVQPLLTNRCATAGCHGPKSESSYQLLHSRLRTTPRNVTHRNLGATLKRIGDYPSDQTLLWMSAISPHGPMDERVLNVKELNTLLTWIRSVNKDLGVAETQGRVVQASAEVPFDATGADPFDPAEFNNRQSGQGPEQEVE